MTRALLIAVSMLSLGQVAHAENKHPTPFGIPLGMPLPSGFLDTYKCVSLPEAVGYYACKNVPQPVAPFTEYAIRVSPAPFWLVAKVVGVHIFNSDKAGEEIKPRYAEVKTILTSNWGKPTNVFEFTDTNPIWIGSDEYAMALAHDEAHASCFWMTEELGILVLQESPSFQDTKLTVAYEELKLSELLDNMSRASKASAL